MYVPFCGLAVVEALSGQKTEVEDPMLREQQKQNGGRYEVRRKAAQAPHTRRMSCAVFARGKGVCACGGQILSGTIVSFKEPRGRRSGFDLREWLTNRLMEIDR